MTTRWAASQWVFRQAHEILCSCGAAEGAKNVGFDSEVSDMMQLSIAKRKH